MKAKYFAVICFILVQPHFASASSNDVDSGKVPIGVTRLPEYGDATDQEGQENQPAASASWRGFDVGSSTNSYNSVPGSYSGAANPVRAGGRQPASAQKAASVARALPASSAGSVNANALNANEFGVSADSATGATGWQNNANASGSVTSSGATTADSYAAGQNALLNQHQQALQQLNGAADASTQQYINNPVGAGLGALRTGGWR